MPGTLDFGGPAALLYIRMMVVSRTARVVIVRRRPNLNGIEAKKLSAAFRHIPVLGSALQAVAKLTEERRSNAAAEIRDAA